MIRARPKKTAAPRYAGLIAANRTTGLLPPAPSPRTIAAGWHGPHTIDTGKYSGINVKQSPPIQTLLPDGPRPVNTSCKGEDIDRYSFLSWATILLGMSVLAFHAAGLNDTLQASASCQVALNGLRTAAACPESDHFAPVARVALDTTVPMANFGVATRIAAGSRSGTRRSP